MDSEFNDEHQFLKISQLSKILAVQPVRRKPADAVQPSEAISPQIWPGGQKSVGWWPSKFGCQPSKHRCGRKAFGHAHVDAPGGLVDQGGDLDQK